MFQIERRKCNKTVDTKKHRMKNKRRELFEISNIKLWKGLKCVNVNIRNKQKLTIELVY